MDEDISNWAPPDRGWHELYARTMQGMFWELQTLTMHPAFKDAEDLGDFAECLGTLLSFRPRTAESIEKPIREELALQHSKHDPVDHETNTPEEAARFEEHRH